MADAKSGGIGCLGVAAILVVVLGLASLFGGDEDSDTGDDSSGSSFDAGPEPDRGDDIGAQVICENFVEDRLKSPSSADFSGAEARHVRGPVWIVAGQVDSDNAFGASIRNTYICKVSYLGNDRWRLVNLAGLTN